VRERGLKPNQSAHTYQAVAPRAGAWIETVLYHQTLIKTPSLPVRERGLKQFDKRRNHLLQIVAPRAGAWIETGLK